MAVADDGDEQVHQDDEDEESEQNEDREFEPIVVVDGVGQVPDPEDSEILG